MPDHTALMPLRIPTGSAVRPDAPEGRNAGASRHWNGFFEAASPDCTESEGLLWLDQIDAATGRSTGVFVDLGWYGSPEDGTFRLVFLDGSWDHELARFESRDRLAVVRELERWLLERPGRRA